MSDPEILLHFKKHVSQINSSSFSPDGKFMATAGDDSFIHLFPTFASHSAKSNFYMSFC